jgi:hypothetical protein
MRATSVKRYPLSYLLSIVAVCGLIVACATRDPQRSENQTPIPTPTVASFFSDSPTTFAEASTVPPGSPQPTLAAIPTPLAPAPTRTADSIAAIPLYDDTLNSDWSPEHSEKVRYDLASKTYVHNAKAAIAVTPSGDFGRFFLTVRKGARKIYPRDRILGISFWLSGGTNTIATSDLAVTVVGSNQYAYWVTDDTSVKIDAPVTAESPLFSETRLYYLHINHAIPPNTWVEVVVWLDDLIHDPDYTNVTGMYIKNDEAALNTYYIDDVRLLVRQQT